MFNQYIQHYYDLAVNTYHVNPIIFLTIYIISIPLFYISFFYVIKEAIAISKEHGKITPKHFIYEKRLAFWGIILMAVYLSPYLYVAIFGQNVPAWFWVIIGLFVAISIWGIYKKVSNKAKTS